MAKAPLTVTDMQVPEDIPAGLQAVRLESSAEGELLDTTGIRTLPNVSFLSE